MSKFLVGNIKGPKGDKGEPGATGPKGEQGIQGPVGPAGGVNSVNGKKGDVNIADALGYTPAGGENLVLDSAQEISNSEYQTASYHLSEKIQLKKEYTITIWGQLGENKTAFNAFIGIEQGRSSLLEKIGDGVYRGFLYIDEWFSDVQKNQSDMLLVFALTNAITTQSTIHKIKLERGTVPNPVWTPAPEDILFDRRNLLTRTKDFYNITTEGIVLDGKYNGFTVIHADATRLSSNYYLIANYENLQLQKSGFYTLSFFARGSGKITCILSTESDNYENINITSNWEKYKVIFKNINGSNGTLYLRAEAGNSVDLCAPKLEYGINLNPYWTPALDDVDIIEETIGENLLKDSQWIIMGTDYITSTIRNPGKIEVIEDGNANGNFWLNNYSLIERVSDYKIGDFYTFSIDIKTTNSKNNSIIKINFRNAKYSIIGTDYTITLLPSNDSKWIRYNLYIDKQTNEIVQAIFSFVTTDNKGMTFEYKNLKFEKGYIVNTKYTPSNTEKFFNSISIISEAHRNNYRGRNLGESTLMLESHKKAIQDGTFKDLWVGDYWTHNGIEYRIADIDYFYNCGDTSFTTHHLVIIPDRNLYNTSMNAGNSTATGYAESDMRTKNLEQAKIKINEAFPGMVLSHRDLLCNAVANGRPSGGGWVDSEIELMNEIMVYGCYVFTPKNDGTNIPYIYTTGNSQLALFRLNPKFIKTKENYWLRDVVSAACFAGMNHAGHAVYYDASDSCGVRPYFCIGVALTGDESDDDMEVVSPMQKGDYMEEELE